MHGQIQPFILGFDIHYTDSIHFTHPTVLSKINMGEYTSSAACFLDEILVIHQFIEEPQSDIWILNWNDLECQPITRTSIDERNVHYWPERDGFLCLVYNTGKDSTNDQVLWFYPRDRSNRGYLIYDPEADILSFAPINQHEIAVLLGNKTNQLAILNVSKKLLNVFSSNVAPGLLYSNNLLYFIHEGKLHTRTLKAYDKESKQAISLFQLQDSVSCFVQGEDDYWFLSKNSRIFAINNDAKDHWEEVLDLSVFGIQFIDKMVICKGRLIISGRTQ